MTSVIEFRRQARMKGLKEREIEALVGWVLYKTPRGQEPHFPSVDEALQSLKKEKK